MHLLIYTWICLGYNKHVTVSSVYFDIMFCSSLSMSIAMTALCWQVECDTKSDGHGLRVAMLHKLSRNVIDVFGSFVFFTHVDPGEKYIYHLLPNSRLQGRTAAGIWVRGRDNTSFLACSCTSFRLLYCPICPAFQLESPPPKTSPLEPANHFIHLGPMGPTPGPTEPDP